MELSTLNKEIKLIMEDNEEKFLKHTDIEPGINFVEEFWITSDTTMGNDRAYFGSYEKALQYANNIYAYRASMNEDGKKPFLIRINGKELSNGGQLRDFLNGEMK